MRACGFRYGRRPGAAVENLCFFLPKGKKGQPVRGSGWAPLPSHQLTMLLDDTPAQDGKKRKSRFSVRPQRHRVGTSAPALVFAASNRGVHDVLEGGSRSRSKVRVWYPWVSHRVVQHGPPRSETRHGDGRTRDLLGSSTKLQYVIEITQQGAHPPPRYHVVASDFNMGQGLADPRCHNVTLEATFLCLLPGSESPTGESAWISHLLSYDFPPAAASAPSSKTTKLRGSKETERERKAKKGEQG